MYIEQFDNRVSSEIAQSLRFYLSHKLIPCRSHEMPGPETKDSLLLTVPVW